MNFGRNSRSSKPNRPHSEFSDPNPAYQGLVDRATLLLSIVDCFAPYIFVVV